MSTYAIGDIQGCYKDFKKLLKQINKMFRNEENLCIMTYTLKF